MEREISNNCPICKKKETKIVRHEEEIITQNSTNICENKDCVLFIDFSKVENWKKIN